MKAATFKIYTTTDNKNLYIKITNVSRWGKVHTQCFDTETDKQWVDSIANHYASYSFTKLTDRRESKGITGRNLFKGRYEHRARIVRRITRLLKQRLKEFDEVK